MLEDIILWNKREHIVFRLWAKDPTIFGQQQPLMLDWLSEPREMLGMLDSMSEMATKVKEHNFRSIVLLGMGGSSLAVKVFQDILAPEHNFFVLDTIHPAAIKRLEHELDLSSTLFIVASKSGSTLEPNLLYRYFLKKLMEQNVAQPFNHFLAITDPGTSLADEAYKNGFLTGPKGNPLTFWALSRHAHGHRHAKTPRKCHSHDRRMWSHHFA
ncbi:MAG: Glucose-6-phosphate isomerase [bacterium ADurb.BinA186]|nr:MAG: Glucose-6-phosphate isomerase [bacterium ADurb.BinA186]